MDQDRIELRALLWGMESYSAERPDYGWMHLTVTPQEFDALERLLRQHLAVPAPVEGVPV